MTYYETQTTIRLKNVIQSSPTPHPFPLDKIMLLLWNKKFITEMYRNMQNFAFNVLQEYSSWASRNGTAPFL